MSPSRNLVVCMLVAGAIMGLSGTVRAQGPTPTPTPVNCASYVNQWRIDNLYASLDANGNYGFELVGNFPQMANCGRKKPNPTSGDYSLVYVYKGTYGTEDKGYYIHTSTQIPSFTDTKVKVGNIYKYSNGGYTAWLLHCTGQAIRGVCMDGGWSYKSINFTVNIPSVTPTPVPLTAPTNFKAQCSSDNKNVVLSWTAPTGASGKYNLVVAYEPYGAAQTRNAQIVTGTSLTTYTYWNSPGFEKVKYRAVVKAIRTGENEYTPTGAGATVEFECPYPPPSPTNACGTPSSKTTIPAPASIMLEDMLIAKSIGEINGKPAYRTLAGPRKLIWTSSTTYPRYYLRIDDESDGKSCEGVKDYCPAVPNTQTASDYTYTFEADKTYRIWVHYADTCNNWSSEVASIYVKAQKITPVDAACSGDTECTGDMVCVSGKCKQACSLIVPLNGSVSCTRGYVNNNECTSSPKPDGSFCRQGIGDGSQPGVCVSGQCYYGKPTPGPGCRYQPVQCANTPCEPQLICENQLTGTTAPTSAPDCRYQPKGDADCSGAIDSKDRLIWAKFYLGQEYEGKQSYHTGDFNKDGKVNLYDAEIWRTWKEAGLPTPSNTPAPTAVAMNPTNTVAPTTALSATPTPVRYGFVKSFGSTGTGNGQFSTPYGVTSDGTNIYVADNGNNRIQVFGLDGTYKSQWSTGAGSAPTDIAYGEGKVYVSQKNMQANISPAWAVYSYNTDGSGQTKIMQSIESAAVAFNKTTKEAWVGWSYYDPYDFRDYRYGITRFNQSNQNVGSISADHETPTGVEITSNRFYVTQASQDGETLVLAYPLNGGTRIDGRALASESQASGISDVAVNDTDILVTGSMPYVMAYSMPGTTFVSKAQFGDRDADTGGRRLAAPGSVTVAGNYVFVTDMSQNRVVVFNK